LKTANPVFSYELWHLEVKGWNVLFTRYCFSSEII